MILLKTTKSASTTTVTVKTATTFRRWQKKKPVATVT